MYFRCQFIKDIRFEFFFAIGAGWLDSWARLTGATGDARSRRQISAPIRPREKMDIDQVPASGTGSSDVACSMWGPDWNVSAPPAMKSESWTPPLIGEIAPFSARKMPSVSELPPVINWTPVPDEVEEHLAPGVIPLRMMLEPPCILLSPALDIEHEGGGRVADQRQVLGRQGKASGHIEDVEPAAAGDRATAQRQRKRLGGRQATIKTGGGARVGNGLGNIGGRLDGATGRQCAAAADDRIGVLLRRKWPPRSCPPPLKARLPFAAKPTLPVILVFPLLIREVGCARAHLQARIVGGLADTDQLTPGDGRNQPHH